MYTQVLAEEMLVPSSRVWPCPSLITLQGGTIHTDCLEAGEEGKPGTGLEGDWV